MSKKTHRKIPGRFFPVLKELMESKLIEYIGPYGLMVYILIGCKQTGEKYHDSEIVCIYNQVRHLMSEPSFIKAKFRLWAYRMIMVTEWGRRTRGPSKFKMNSKWRTLIRMEPKLEEIHSLVRQYETVLRSKINPQSSKLKELRKIKSKIMEVVV